MIEESSLPTKSQTYLENIIYINVSLNIYFKTQILNMYLIPYHVFSVYLLGKTSMSIIHEMQEIPQDPMR